jgi:hypothetical protein
MAVMSAISVPVGFVVGNPEEDVAAGPAGMDYELLADGVPGMIVHRATGDHLLISSDEGVLKDDAEIALNLDGPRALRHARSRRRADFTERVRELRARRMDAREQAPRGASALVVSCPERPVLVTNIANAFPRSLLDQLT